MTARESSRQTWASPATRQSTSSTTTAIVVSGSEQYDLAVPAGDAQAFIKNGVLTVEVTSDSEEAHE